LVSAHHFLFLLWISMGNVNRRYVKVTVDSDGDGLSNEEETLLGTNMEAGDTDDDGVTDADDVKPRDPYFSNPTMPLPVQCEQGVVDDAGTERPFALSASDGAVLLRIRAVPNAARTSVHNGGEGGGTCTITWPYTVVGSTNGGGVTATVLNRDSAAADAARFVDGKVMVLTQAGETDTWAFDGADFAPLVDTTATTLSHDLSTGLSFNIHLVGLAMDAETLSADLTWRVAGSSQHDPNGIEVSIDTVRACKTHH
jgi:hypothetical protein